MNENIISALILTYNEELHIERCIKSIQQFAHEIFIIDSYSTDNTVQIAEKLGAKVYQNPWENYASQFQWGLDNCPIATTWVMRLDADEYVTEALASEIIRNIPDANPNVSGYYIKRQVHFKEKWIKHGSYYPIWLLRIWRFGNGRIEQRWMDEHIKLSTGECEYLQNDIVDHNKNDLTWWINKHNSYATREAIDILNLSHNFIQYDEIDSRINGTQEERKRYLKKVYAKLPLFLRPFIYFFWRYFVRLGILDGKQGLIWHFLQGFWYRFLVDAKIYEITQKSRTENVSIHNILKRDYGL